jgi:hypothetical protein
MRLTPHFTLAELTVTSTGLPNVPSSAEAEALRELCLRVLEPWRAVVGPLRVTSGFRSRAVNDELRKRGYSASRTSQHLRGEAADVVPVRGDLVSAWAALVSLVERGLPVDQAIVYQRGPGKGWIHVSHDEVPRRQLLVQDAAGRYHDYGSWVGPLVLP